MTTDTSPTGPTRRPRLGIVGFFGHGNYGDELFLDVYQEHFGEQYDLTVIPDLPTKPYFSRRPHEKVAEVDAILLGGGDLIRPWAIDERYFHPAYLEKPIFMLGLGVPLRSGSQARNNVPHINKRYQEFFQHPNVRFVGVRDESSRSWVESNLQPSAPLISRSDIVCALTLPQVDKPEGGPILGIVTRFRPGQDVPDDYSQLEALGATLQERGWTIRHIVLGTGIVGQRDLENADDLKLPGKSVIHSENLDDLSRAIGECTALASMKFHGSVVATMYGVPSIVLIPTSKNRSFMRRLNRDDLLARFDAPDLLSRFTPQPEPINPLSVTRRRAEATEALNMVKAELTKTLTH